MISPTFNAHTMTKTILYRILITVVVASGFRLQLVAQGPPSAAFNASVTSGCAPLLVSFTDLSTGNPESWNWDLGNGTFSTLQNPSVTYITPGTYTITLTATNAAGTNSIVQTNYIKVYDKPDVNFSASDTVGCIPFSVSFTDESSSGQENNITAWEWSFDDGPVSYEQQPRHQFNRPGNFNIALKVTTAAGCFNVLNKLAYIKARDTVHTNFYFSPPTQCRPPETISFYNSTQGDSTLNYLWDFGDGNTSTEADPSHTYTSSGAFTVTLISVNHAGCADTLQLKDSLVIRGAQAVILGQDTVCSGIQAVYSNGTVPAALTSQWIFSDGTNAYGNTVNKTWAQSGTYQIKLISNAGICSDSVIKNIIVKDNSSFNFSSSDSFRCQPPFPVNFTDLSTGSNEWLWDFGDGATSTLQHPQHVYRDSGLFTVRLLVKDNAGCSGNVLKTGFIKITKPSIEMDTREGGGCIPYGFQPRPYATAPDGIATYFWDFGNGTTSAEQYPTAIYTDTGRYTIKLVVVSNDGCRDSAVIINGVKTGTPPSVDFSASATTICPGSSVQFSDMSSPADQWLWEFADGTISTEQNPLLFFNDTITQHVKLTVWNNGCKDSALKENYIHVLAGKARFRPVFNCSNPAEVYFKDSSIAPQIWQWNFGDGSSSTEQNPTHLFGNNQEYMVTLTTTNGQCTNTDTINIHIFNRQTDFTASTTTICKNEPINFTATGIALDRITQYRWDFGDGVIDSSSASTVTHVYRHRGNYTVSLITTDEHGCSSSEVKADLITVFGPDAGFTISNNGGCVNQTVTFIDSSANTATQWHWDFGDGTTFIYTGSNQPTVTHVYHNRGFYYPSLKVIDAAGCSDSISYFNPVTITQPVVNFSANNRTSCSKDTLQLQNNSTGVGLVYNWDFGDNSYSHDSLPVKWYVSEGTYSIRLRITDINGCSDSMTYNNYIDVKNVHAAFSTSDTVGLCVPYRASFTNNSQNAVSQQWNFGDGGYSSSLNPVYYYSRPGNYTVMLTATRSASCYSTDSVKIRITAPSGILQQQAASGCAPLQVYLHVSTTDKVSYLWDFNDGTSFASADSAVSYTYRLPGNFLPRVILKDSLGCAVPVYGSDSIRLYNTHVDFGTNDTIACTGTAIRFSDSSYSGSPVASYRWDFGDGNFSVERNPVHRYSTAGVYTVKLVINTLYGCNDSIIKQEFVRVHDKPEISITGNENSYCGPSQIQFNGIANGNPDLLQWHWSAGEGQEFYIRNPLVTINDTGVHNIILTAMYTAGCGDTMATQLRINPVPRLYTGNDTTVCAGSPLQLRVENAATINWAPASLFTCSNCAVTSVTVDNDSWVSVSGTNNEGCAKTDSIRIRVKKPFTVSGLQDVWLCKDKSVKLQANGAEIYSWQPAQGLSSTSISNPVAQPAATTVYTLTATDSLHCFTSTTAVKVHVLQPPVITVTSPVTLSSGSSVTMPVQYSGDISYYKWLPAKGLSCYDCATPAVTGSSSIIYKIIAGNEGGCIAENAVKVVVACDNNIVNMPTAFTPNNDGLNDIFHPLGTADVKVSVFKIFNRYGQLIFVTGNFLLSDKRSGWDGRYQSADQPAGTYVYSLEYVCANNEVNTVNGTVVLIR